MFRLHDAVALLSSVVLCAALPVLDLSGEMTSDVNEPPFPIVNVIADQPLNTLQSNDQLRGVRHAELSMLEKVRAAQKSFELSSGAILEDQNQQLDTLRQMSAHLNDMARVSASKR